METFLALAGALWILMGLGVLATAKSAIHEILACLAVSFGLMFWGFAGIMGRMRAMEKSWRAMQHPTAVESPRVTKLEIGTPIEQAINGVRAGTGPVSSRL
jgi:hypothetical protein